MDYFANIHTLEELRSLYRKLAFLHHPDKNGDTATMQEINRQYSLKSNKLINSNNTFDDARKDSEMKISEEMKIKITALLNFQNIDIEIIGSWLWVSGSTYPIRLVIKNLGFTFSKPKCAWYWHLGEFSKKSGLILSMEEIRNLFPSEKIDNSKAFYTNLLK